MTGPQMVLTMKLTTFAWNVYDGRRPLAVSWSSKRHAYPTCSHLFISKELDKWQAEKRVAQYPSLLAFLGYSYVLNVIFYGPTYSDSKSAVYIASTSLASLSDLTLISRRICPLLMNPYSSLTARTRPRTEDLYQRAASALDTSRC